MDIFIDEKDYDRFLKLLYIANSKNLGKYSDVETSPGRTWTMTSTDSMVHIGAFCLMPNHFHLLIRVKDGKDASLFLQKLLTSYSVYFNKKYSRNGVLFQGKTKAQHASEDPYLKYLFAYIHLNPVKLIEPKWKELGLKNFLKAQKHLTQYKYSTYCEYNNIERPENKIINKEIFPSYFNNPKEHMSELFEWLQFDKKHDQGI